MTTTSYRVSRCTDPRNAPQEIFWAEINGDKYLVRNEFVSSVREMVPVPALKDAIGTIKALLKRVEQCNAVDPKDVVNVARDRELFELRVQAQAFNLLLRFYETEPANAPHTIVMLKAHAKDLAAPHLMNDEQNREIDEASRRRTLGMKNQWGIK